MINETKKWMDYVVAVLIIISAMSCAARKSAALSGSQAIKDTSFTIYSAYLKELKKYPFIKIADPELSEGSAIHLNLKFKSSSDRQLLADIYYPKTSNRMLPAILMIHGGGWKSGDKSQMAAIGKALANKGFVAVSAEYRLSPEAKYPAGLNDLRDALKWMKSVSKRYAIDTSKIGVLGVSAGGQLAALLGTINTGNNSMGIKAVVDIDGILAFHHPESQEGQVASEWLGGTYDEKQSIWAEASALTHAGPNTPPLLFINSQHQRFHAGRDDLIKKISPYGIYTEVHTLPDTPHTFWLFQPWFDPTVSHVVTFLNKIFA